MNSNTQPRPGYEVNLALAPLHWTPESWQVRRFFNPSWVNSAWLGTVWNLIVLPSRLWHEFGALLVRGHFIIAALQLFVNIPGSFLIHLWWGITGQARAVKLPIEVIADARFLDEQECMAAMRKGSFHLVRGLSKDQ